MHKRHQLRDHSRVLGSSLCSSGPTGNRESRIMATVKLETSDGVVLDVDVQIAQCSKTIRAWMDCVEDGEAIRLMDVDSAILEKVLQWAAFHRNDPEPVVPQPPVQYGMCSWDRDFLEVDVPTLVGLTSAADYLDIPRLCRLLCFTLAQKMRGKTTEEMRTMFDIENDLTPEEEEQIRAENEWIEEISPNNSWNDWFE